MRTQADKIFLNLLKETLTGDVLETRNSVVVSNTTGLHARFTSTPLLTVRRTAWKKALLEMEWFLSGKSECPEGLMDWWGEQLNENKSYIRGYAEQLRHYTSSTGAFDQIEFIRNAIKEHPNSRRLITTTWHPEEMANITQINANNKTPTCCHGTVTQFFVRNNTLSLHTYQRSADLLLGVHHNWIQYWALLNYLANDANYNVGAMVWTYGDLHLYQHPTHIEVANALLLYANIATDLEEEEEAPKLVLKNAQESEFLADNFDICGKASVPVSKLRPALL